MKLYKNNKIPVIKERHILSFNTSPINQDLNGHKRTYSTFLEDFHPSRREALNLKINKSKNVLSSPPATKSANNSNDLYKSTLPEPAFELYRNKSLTSTETFRLPLPLHSCASSSSFIQKAPIRNGKQFSRCEENSETTNISYDHKLCSHPSLILNDRTLLKISQSLYNKNNVNLESSNYKYREKASRKEFRGNCSTCWLAVSKEKSCGRIEDSHWTSKPQRLDYDNSFYFKSERTTPPKLEKAKLTTSTEVKATTLPILTTTGLPSLSFHPSHLHSYFSSSVQNNSGGFCSILPIRMKGKGNRINSSGSNHQVANSATQPSTPRTPGTPSDTALTSNPPTPGNNSSNSMVSSSPQYVAITVEAGPSAGNDSEMSSGGNSYVTYVEGSSDHSSTIYATAPTTVAGNGQNMSYPLYATVGGGCETATAYSSGSNNASQYFTGGTSNNGVTYTQEGGVYLVQSPTSSNNNNNILTTESGASTTLSNRVSPATKRKKTVPELCPIYPSPTATTSPQGQNSFNQHRARRPRQEEVYYDDDGDGVYMVEENDTDIPGTYPSNSGNPTSSSSLIPEMDNFGFHPNDMHSETMHYDPTVDDLLYTSTANAAVRTNPLTVQWLLENYENAEGVSLPRSTLYGHYLRHCNENKLDPVNAASFGKLIRSVFLGLRTRRLGTRGNSKYHYYGIRLKPNSPLNHVKDEDFLTNGNYASNGHHNSSAGSGHKGGSGSSGHHNGSGMGGGGNSNKRLKSSSRNEMGDGTATNGGDTSAFLPFLGELNQAILDEMPELDAGDELYPEGIVENDLFVFRSLYREHCKALLDCLLNFHLSAFEENWKLFWRGDETVMLLEGCADYEKILPKSKMIQICKMKVVQDFVNDVDYNLYQHIVEILLPDVLHTIPSGMTQAIRNFAKILESWVSASMTGYPESIVTIRKSAANALAQTLRRYTSLNHLAQAARAVLQNQTQITQMLTDLGRVDFKNVEEQASWVCGCGENTVPSLEQDFKTTLSQQQTLDEWAAWLEKVVDKIVKPHENSSNFVNIARNFLLKWSFYSSLIIRDLTLRSAASFGSFHLLRLLYDEYIFYVVEHRVAKVTGVNPIQVIGKRSSDSAFSENMVSHQQPQVRANTEKIYKQNGSGINRTDNTSVVQNSTPQQSNLVVAIKSAPTVRRTSRNFLTS